MTTLLSAVALIVGAGVGAGVATSDDAVLQRAVAGMITDSNAHSRHLLRLADIEDALFDAELVGAWACDVASDLDVDRAVCSPYRFASYIERRREDQRPAGGIGDEGAVDYGDWTLVETKARSSDGLVVVLRQDVSVTSELSTTSALQRPIGGGMSRREWAHLNVVLVEGRALVRSLVVVPSDKAATTTPKSAAPSALRRLCQARPTLGPRTAWRLTRQVEPEEIDGLVVFGLAAPSMQPVILKGLAASWGLSCAFPATAADDGIIAAEAAVVVPPLPPGLRRSTSLPTSLLMAVAETVELGINTAPTTTRWRDVQRALPSCAGRDVGAQWVPPACGVSSFSLASSADPGPAMFDSRRLGAPHVVDVERADDARGQRWRVWLEAAAMHGLRHQQLQEWRLEGPEPQLPWRLDRVLTPPLRSAFSTQRSIMQNPQLVALCASAPSASSSEAAKAAGTQRGDVGAAILAAPEPKRRAMIEAMVFAQGIESCAWLSGH